MITNYSEEDKWWEEPKTKERDWLIREDMFPFISRIVKTNLTKEEADTMCRFFNMECDHFTSYSVARNKK